MKNKIYVGCFLTLMTIGFTAGAQVYKTAADTVKLNKEFTEVSNDIASLTAKISTAEKNMPGYQSKSDKAQSNAHDAAVSSSAQSEKATEGGIKQARKAKRNSKKAFREAKDARSANNNLSNQNGKIASLKGQLAKKQERLEQLKAMRISIDNSVPQK